MSRQGGTNRRRSGFGWILVVGSVLLIAAVGVNLSVTRPWEAEAQEPADPSYNRLQDPTSAEIRRADSAEARLKVGEAVERRWLAQEAELQPILAAPARWKLLPQWIESSYADAGGQFWFRVSHNGERKEVHWSVERAARGETRIIRGGRLLLRDSRGRFWVRLESSPHVLLCFDGAAWSERPAIDPVPPVPSGRPSRSVRGEFLDMAAEDQQGNVYFVSGASELGHGVHKFDTKGNWTFDLLSQPGADDPFFQSNPFFVVQRHGQIALAAGTRRIDHQRIPPAAKVLVGTEWDSIGTLICPQQKHHVSKLLPLPDGSFAAFCDDDAHAFLFWFQQSPSPPVESVIAWSTQLLSDDPAARELAFEALLAQGPGILPLIPKVIEEAADEPQRIALLDVQDRLQAMRDYTDPSKFTYGGRFYFEEAHLLSRALDGTVRLHVHDCTDRRHFSDRKNSVLSVAPDGTWSFDSVPLEQWARFAMDCHFDDCYEDGTGLIWATDEFGYDRQLHVQPLNRVGLRMDQILCGDRDGVTFFKTDGGRYIVMCDARRPDVPPELPQEDVIAAPIYHISGERDAWACGIVGPAARGLVHLTGQGAVPIAPGWDIGRVLDVYPLRNGAAIVLLIAPTLDTPMSHWYRFWDGTQWHGADTFPELVRAHADRLMPLAPHTKAIESVNSTSRMTLFGDGKQRMWLYQGKESDRHGRVLPPTAELYDGTRWHRLRAEAPDQDWGIGDTVDLGTSVLVSSSEPVRHAIASFDGAEFKFAPFDPLQERGQSYNRLLHGTEGRVWVTRHAPNGEPKLFELTGGALVAVESPGVPDLVDASNRVWGIARNTVMVRTPSGMIGRLDIPGLILNPRITQSPDGRIWLLHGDGISNLKVSQHLSQVEIAEVARYKWNAPLNEFLTVFCDDGNGLWIGGRGNRQVRVQLPPIE